jgi:hypothetical protein
VENLEGNLGEIEEEILGEDRMEIQGEGPTEIHREHQEEMEETEQEIEEEAEASEEGVRTRSGRAIKRPSKFMAVTKVSQLEWKDKACEVSIKLELSHLFNELKALKVIKKAEINKSTKVLKMHMFLVHKYLENGTFDKVKAQLVADGRDQDPVLYPNKLSPTVAIHLVYTVLGSAATKLWKIVMKINV